VNSERPTVVIVDDHALLRAGVRAELEGRVEIVGEAGTVTDAIAIITATQPDVVLLDVHMPDGGGLAVIDGIRAADTTTRVLALSVSDAPEDVTKTISAEELADAIHNVARGQVVLSQRLAGFVLDAFNAPPTEPTDPEIDQLTPREQEILEHIARGYLYKEIAAKLGISARTVETHVSQVLRKLHLTNRHQLARWATQHRIVD
jgi:DNA-binding NarL/FixJ family response regulator